MIESDVAFPPASPDRLARYATYWKQPSKPLPGSYLNKPLVEVDGRPLFGELMDGVFDQFAKFERAKTAERTRRGKLRKAREGRVIRGGTIRIPLHRSRRRIACPRAGDGDRREDLPICCRRSGGQSDTGPPARAGDTNPEGRTSVGRSCAEAAYSKRHLPAAYFPRDRVLGNSGSGGPAKSQRTLRNTVVQP
jgi:hypothetical protein